MGVRLWISAAVVSFHDYQTLPVPADVAVPVSASAVGGAPGFSDHPVGHSVMDPYVLAWIRISKGTWQKSRGEISVLFPEVIFECPVDPCASADGSVDQEHGVVHVDV